MLLSLETVNLQDYMNLFDNNIQLSENRSSLFSILIILVIVFVGFQIIGPLIGMVFALPFMQGSLIEQLELLSSGNPGTDMRVPLMIMQGTGTLVGMVVIPWAYLKAQERKGFAIFFRQKVNYPALVLTIAIVIIFMGFNSLIIEWNANITFPDFMSGFEEWARKTEDMAAELTTFITSFDSTGQFILGFFVIAVLPAIGEEIVFRGLIQNEFYTLSKNIHVAIWVSAILFSAIHLQFYGFVPRLLLGALFGYLYYWSGNLLVPILAHFINNGFTVMMLYLHDIGVIDINLENPESASLPSALIFGIITLLLLYIFRRLFIKARSAG